MASFFIQLDKPYYTAGDTIAGEVLMTVPASISGCKGVSLRLSAFECLKWVSPHRITPPQPSPVKQGPSSVLPGNQPLHHVDKIEVSECESEQKSDSGLRPRLIRTASNEFYELEFHEERREFVSATTKLFQGGKLAAGQYSFPFSFKSLEDWPGSFSFGSEQRKAQVRYGLTAWIDPVSPHFDFQSSREVSVVESGRGEAARREFNCQVTSFLCIGKGTTTYSLSWTEDSLASTSNLALTIAVDNSHCSVDIKGIEVAIVQSHNLQDGKLTEQIIFSRVVPGVRAGEKKTEDKAIVEGIDLSKVKGLLATTHGKLANSETRITATLIYDALFFSCPPVSLPIKIRTAQTPSHLPLNMQKGFSPKKMPASLLILENPLKAAETGEKFHG